ncbi:NfeD family protein [Limnoglobus roseus]|uniref:NfeD-like C-terminal domain-containing protein n=1 Tax=Limnoglobus roseus TaxID=2598579 RepID=A0A5C1AKC3_9BACT|nr:NfeD family protein [Limnoglobus roseus]QEL18142.1 hypothetical protein PX52LOC_05156 [Limnoglobus roseus]
MSYLSIAIVLAAIGLILFMAEYFLPTGGILIVAGFLVSLAAVAVVAANAEDYRETVAAVVVLCIGEPIFVIAGMSVWGRRMALRALEGDDGNSLNEPEREGDKLVGKIGKTVTPLRPSGAAVFDGRRVDVVTEGMMIDVGVWVKCLEVRGSRVVVRQIAKPPDLNDFDLDDLK